MPDKISIIILNWNGKEYLANCFNSISQQTFKDYEVIFVDNNSTDDSVDFTRQRFPWVNIVELEENRGFVGGNNAGAEKATGEYLFFLNNDTKLDPRCLETLLRYFEQHPEVGILGCLQYSYDGKHIIEESGAYDIFGYPCRGIYSDNKTFYVYGASLFIKKELFSEIDGFDPNYFNKCEDIDLCWRTRLLGYDVKCLPSAIIYHKWGAATFVEEMGKKKKYATTIFSGYLGERNSLRNILKNYSFIFLLFVIPARFIFNISEIVLFILIGKFTVVRKAYLSAWWWNIKNFQDTWSKRRKIQNTRKVNDLKIMKNMLFRYGKINQFLQIGIPKIRDIDMSHFID